MRCNHAFLFAIVPVHQGPDVRAEWRKRSCHELPVYVDVVVVTKVPPLDTRFETGHAESKGNESLTCLLMCELEWLGCRQ